MRKLFRDDIEVRENIVTVKPDSTIRHGIISPVDLQIGRGCVIYYDVISKKNIVAENITVCGDMLARGDITLISSANIDGKIVAGGNIIVEGDVEAEELLADGDIFIMKNVTAKRVEANGDLIIKGKLRAINFSAGGRIVKV
ncbi:MAG: hypothetical protein QMD21_02955 [Candidatus Thermoplasmatota archaeon]|nr:hypothetical protein [Candidatus Thermoplasmatota archaeon]MDI6887188.1 hypothetical protein [Candidatus Thermoplasmatota archaeon]